MAKYDCVVGLYLEVKSEVYGDILRKGKVNSIRPTKGSRANGYELLLGKEVYSVFLDRIDIGRLMNIKETQTVSIFNRPDMKTYKFTKKLGV